MIQNNKRNSTISLKRYYTKRNLFERSIPMNTKQKEFERYIAQQERFFHEFMNIHQEYNNFVNQLNPRAQQAKDEGNHYDYVAKSLSYANKDEGEGYFDSSSSTFFHFNPATDKMNTAQHLFINRIINKFNELFGPVYMFRHTHEVFPRFGYDNSFKLITAKEVVNWIESEKRGEGLQYRLAHKSPFSHKPGSKQISYVDDSWDRSERDNARVYPASHYRELYGALHFVEYGNTLFEETYAFLDNILQNADASDLKEPFDIPASQKVKSIRFYMNGKITITFEDVETAIQFFQFVNALRTFEH